MSFIWKILIVLNTVISCISMLYLYALIAPNPYDRVHYEIEQIKMDISQLNQDRDSIKCDIEAINSNVVVHK